MTGVQTCALPIYDAIRELEDNEAVWLEMAEEDGETIPAPTVEKIQEYSGKFTVRLSKSLHREIAKRAEMEGVSLNQYMVEAAAEKLGRIPKQDAIMIGKAFREFALVIQNTSGILEGTQNIVYDMSEITAKMVRETSHGAEWGTSFNSFNYIKRNEESEVCN